MSTKILGNNYLLWIESAVAGTYNYPLGQGNLSITRSSSKVDTTSKDDGRYGSSGPGLIDLGVSLEIMPKLPDATGYTRLETLSLANPPAPFNIQIRKNGTSGASGDVVFQCSVYGNLDSSDFNQNAAGSVKASFVAAAAPTVDTLA
ncbi:MAG TPA: phage tail tube protein [Allosphingosinicella sp.]|jgi:hypothetical protein